MSNNIDVLRDKLFSRMTGAEDPAVRPGDTVLHCYNLFMMFLIQEAEEGVSGNSKLRLLQSARARAKERCYFLLQLAHKPYSFMALADFSSAIQNTRHSLKNG